MLIGELVASDVPLVYFQSPSITRFLAMHHLCYVRGLARGLLNLGVSAFLVGVRYLSRVETIGLFPLDRHLETWLGGEYSGVDICFAVQTLENLDVGVVKAAIIKSLPSTKLELVFCAKSALVDAGSALWVADMMSELSVSSVLGLVGEGAGVLLALLFGVVKIDLVEPSLSGVVQLSNVVVWNSVSALYLESCTTFCLKYSVYIAFTDSIVAIFRSTLYLASPSFLFSAVSPLLCSLLSTLLRSEMLLLTFSICLEVLVRGVYSLLRQETASQPGWRSSSSTTGDSLEAMSSCRSIILSKAHTIVN